MKKLIIIPLLFVCLILSATNYYISPTGSDATGVGSFANPWFSIGKGYMNVLDPGDTVFCRGGKYMYVAQQQIYIGGVGGTRGHEIVFINYPGETPVFDFYNWDMSGLSPDPLRVGIYICCNVGYLKFQGLRVTRMWKINTNNGRAHGWLLTENVHHITFTQCIADSIAGRGFLVGAAEEVRFYNCDAYMCADPQDSDPGNAGVGFAVYGTMSETMADSVLFYGCRAWQCSDQGFSGGDGYYTIFDRCWAFANGLVAEGYTAGGQQGFKPGYTYYDVDSISVLIKNCLSVFNHSYGLNENTDNAATNKLNLRVYNNTFYKNGLDGIISTRFYNTLDNVNKYVNNISYDNDRYDMLIMLSATHYYNSWDNPYCPTCDVTGGIIGATTVTNADFKDLPADEAECLSVLGAARQADGSLPDIGDHFQLAEGSDLIGIGIGLGIPYDGAGNYWDAETPSIGAFEYDGTLPEPPELPQVSTTAITTYNAYIATLGGTITSDGGGTLTASGIVWDTDINPTLSDNVIQAYELTEDTFTVLLRNIGGGVTIHIRAFATNTTGTSYGADVTLTTPSIAVMKSAAGKIYKYGTKTLIYK